MQELTLQEDDRSRSRRPDWRLLDDKGKRNWSCCQMSRRWNWAPQAMLKLQMKFEEKKRRGEMLLSWKEEKGRGEVLLARCHCGEMVSPSWWSRLQNYMENRNFCPGKLILDGKLSPGKLLWGKTMFWTENFVLFLRHHPAKVVTEEMRKRWSHQLPEVRGVREQFNKKN